MKNYCYSLFNRLAMAGLVAGAMASNHLSAQSLDNGVEPANLGKGDWIYFLSTATNKLGGNVASVTDVASLMNYEKSQGMDFIIVKAGDGASQFPSGSPQFTASLVSAAHTAGLKIFGYSRSFGTNIPGEITLATNVYNMGADGFVIDAEVEWESSNLANNTTLATQLCQGIRAGFPTRFLAHSPLPIISLHNTFPYKEFGLYCDAVMPQDYWKSIGYAPDQMVTTMDTEWRNWQSGLTGNFTNSIKPIAPVGQGWSPSSSETVTSAEITTFVNSLITDTNPVTRGGYRGVSWWRADLHTTDQWTGINGSDIGGSQTNAPAISNVAATGITGTAATITWATDISSDSVVEYGATTSYGSSATNAALTFNHSVSLSGLVVSTTYHYHVKSRSASLNQTISGDLTFTTASAGSVSDIIIDNTSATVVGTWSTGSSSTDKYGADYRFKGQGTGAAYLQYTPSVTTAGNYQVYEWHPIGSNRTTNAPYVITYNGGSQTVFINQKVSGGVWNFIGSYPFAAGTSGNIKITDNIPDSTQMVLADAIKLVYIAPPPPPAAPGGLAATAVSSSQINLTWTDNSTNENNFVLGCSITAGGPYTDIATLSANVASYNDAGRAANTTYYYVVRASNANGASTNSNQASATTPQVLPAAPSGLLATAVSSSQINLSWSDNSTNESNFIVARSTTSGGSYTDIATLGANSTSYSDAGISSSTTYYYVVRASNTAGASANSAQASATTLSALPVAPSGLAAAAISASQINLTWADNATNELNFIVARSTTAGGPYTDMATLGANTSSYSDAGCAANTAYFYVVRASNTSGASANSSEASATTPQVLPVAPSGLTVTAVSASQINLSWADNSNIEDNYIVARSATSGGPYTDIAVLGANITSYINTGLTPSTTYYYVVRAKNSAGSSANTAQASATTFATIPAAPSSLVAQAISATQVNLTWVDNANNELNYIVSRGATSGGPYADIATLGASVSSYSDSTCTPNTTYYYVVRASNTAGASASSNEAMGSTPQVAPVAPSGLAATTASSTQVNLTWTDNSTNELNFIVGRSTSSGGPYTDIVILGANVTSYSDTGLAAGTVYYYVVRSSNSAGSSLNSAQASATTLAIPAAPSSLVAQAISASQVSLTWGDNSSNETGFIVSRSTTAGGPYTDIVTASANSTSFTDSGLLANTTYYYVVRAHSSGGDSAYSNEGPTTTYVTDLLIDNLSANVVGTWSTGTSATDKYGSNYRFKGQGTGTGYLQFTPKITTAGIYAVYEWHPIGANRTTNAPHVITYSGGTQTVYVNQQVNGGNWNLLGNYSFAAGSSGNVQITDAFADTAQMVIADAIQFVLIPVPAAPSGLTATAASKSQINLKWTDNATNETSMVVARSTTSGGPYTTIATLAAGTTSYSNTGLTAGTTYYYVVHAVGAGGTSANSAQASAAPVADIIIDNPAATVTGTWSTGTSSTDKYGSDYRFKSPGAGAGYLKYTPTIPTAGHYQVYEWHSVGSNRATAAPFVVTYNGGSQTVSVNEQVNGGQWNSIGTFALAAGTGGSVKITDNFTDTTRVVIADAVKLVYVGP
ncbi:fibronectin type III domain-containing protein [Pedosphaera parvula]|uniref:Fibronectin type III domain protein n=1 Tax=Pedosphaera parvula (strain Ellin514) TaxID=320771 RepID=B9XEJ9_PEDPL|nr:fibronectin type III domain-containing protein [Pedosphaera parvula]EEF61713.1 Fibronectin type III domain protein [Pedosphaera parvula Ellin514]